MAPVAAVRVLRERLDDAGVPVAAVYLPHTDHAFDIGTTWSPAARVAVHILERFLAGLATSDQRAGTRPSPSGARVR
jgi:acetyl esterase/lipase